MDQADRLNRLAHHIALALAIAVLVVTAGSGTAPAGQQLGVLEAVRGRGHVICGFTRSAPGFSTVDGRGQWSGLDVDLCRAVAAATLGDPTRIKPMMMAPQAGPQSLHANEIDVLATSSPIGLDREATHHIRFPAVLFHETVGLLVHKAQAVTSARELSGASICVGKGSDEQQALVDYFAAHSLKLEPILIERLEDGIRAYSSGRCQAIAADTSMLAILKSRLNKPTDHHILPEPIAVTPLGPAVRSGDERWFQIVRWTIYALVAAEAVSLTSGRAEQLKASSHPDVRRLLGVDGDLGAPLGLTRDWVHQVVKAVGNYGEIFERNFGPGSALGIERRVNQLWSKGGLIVAPLLR